MRNAHELIWKEKSLFVILHRIHRSENCVPFLCWSFTVKIIMFFERIRISWNAFVRNAHVKLWNEKRLFGICQCIVKSENSVLLLCRHFTFKDIHVLLKVNEFHEMLFWETHMTFNEKIIRCLGYVIVLLKVRTVFLDSFEVLLWKIIMFIWKWMNFMKCFCEKHTCDTLKWEAYVWDMSKYC